MCVHDYCHIRHNFKDDRKLVTIPCYYVGETNRGGWIIRQLFKSSRENSDSAKIGKTIERYLYMDTIVLIQLKHTDINITFYFKGGRGEEFPGGDKCPPPQKKTLLMQCLVPHFFWKLKLMQNQKFVATFIYSSILPE